MWVGWLGTALWLLVAAFIVTPKWPELASASPNTIGDTLAGFVAPLAFLWLIVATWLQRQELSLQRKELAESRQVLAGQQRELENTARENAEQTRIMQQTLQTSQDQSVFEEHKLRLYYLAKYIQTVARSDSLLLLGRVDGLG
jgi:type VI protein secretion system component VasK